jgi:hypothetical protein
MVPSVDWHPYCEEEDVMSIFVAERSLKGIAMEDLAAAQRRAIDTAQAFRREGRSVRYLRSTFVPDSGSCLCLFEANDAATVQALNDTAQVPYDRIAPALDLRA